MTEPAGAPATPVGLPAGVRDVLPVEAEELRAIERAIRDRFASYGYREVVTPVLELAAVLDRAQDDAATAPAYRLFDDRGRVLALRPDLTIPAARLIATRMRDREGPVRVFYVAHVFRTPPPGRPRPAQQRQAGVELVGPGGPEADAEAIALLVDSLADTGLGRVRIGVADVSLTEAVLSALGVEAPAAARLRAALAARNFVAWGRGVATLGLGEEEARLLAGLPALRGGPDVLAKVVEAVPQAAPACERLERVLQIGGRGDGEAEVGVDLGVLRDWPYYSGVVFEAYAPGVSEPVAVGGRYDALGARFGTDRASVGFAIRIDMLHRALVPQARNGTPRQGVVVADGFGAEAATARSLRGAGLAAVVVGADADAERLAEEDDWRYVVRREGPGFAVLDRRTGERFSCGRPEEVLPSRA